ncbi:exopolyphosphatase [Nocardia sp. NRRL S-836]|nr:exopolyphosphatase [Nocardia sp. NRRL S-836]
MSAVREQLEGGHLDVLTGDYLAELTMLILGRDRMKDPGLGYAKTFLRQMEDCLGLALDKGVKIVTNAGGLNPEGLARKLGTTVGYAGGTGASRANATDINAERAETRHADAKHGNASHGNANHDNASHGNGNGNGNANQGNGNGGSPRIGYVTGDDLKDRFPQALTANAYLGAWEIADCLNQGAQVVVTGRVTDASLVVGPAAAHFGWKRDDWDRLAGATVAGHVLECGTQATGGNYSFFTEIDVTRPGFPIAEIREDGSSLITKHKGTGGQVTVDTVTAQLLYEIGDPAYLGPDVTTHFDTIRLSSYERGVEISGTKGSPPPDTLKVCLNTLGGFRNGTTFVLTGLDVDRKAALVQQQLRDAIGDEGLTWTLARTDQPDAPTEEQASALLHVTIKTPDPKRAKAFSRAAIELALASYPGFHVTAPPSDGTPFGVYRAAYVHRDEVSAKAVLL